MEVGLVRQASRILSSYRHWLGRELVERGRNSLEDARELWHASVVVVSHGSEADPLLNYANRQAQALWESDLSGLAGLPSRFTAEPMERAEREAMLKRTEAFGYVDDYRGIRISRLGRRFEIIKAVVWNVLDERGRPAGQAAAFDQWIELP
ncbi:MAG: MEKHLA domain-containing protein [Verrucomicrobia bacterium]|jgi:hypothetical protein|nr:MAG: MEKHLA domain-containing protein [Verrucomicrobiota bacterium]